MDIDTFSRINPKDDSFWVGSWLYISSFWLFLIIFMLPATYAAAKHDLKAMYAAKEKHTAEIKAVSNS